jgi:hypothetical protein
VSEEKFSKCEEGEKKCKCSISGVRKKRIERKVPRKKSKCFGVEILLSSCSLAELYVNLQVKITERKMLKIFKVCSGWVFEVLNLRFALGNLKLKKCWGCGCLLSWASC